MIIKYPITYTWVDYPDDDSLALIIYMMGCTNNCYGCHNPFFKDPFYKEVQPFVSFIEGVDFISNEIKRVCNILLTNKVVLSGGDPLSIYNIEGTKSILLNNNNIDFCIYTSMDINDVKKNNVQGFKFIKCGEYDINKAQSPEKTNKYLQFASSNQKLYNERGDLLSDNGRYYF
jgi:organic radical activating enzyme